MRTVRRLTVAVLGVVALATVIGAVYAVFAMRTSTDTAFREHSKPSPVVSPPGPTVAGTEAATPTVPPTPSPPTAAPTNAAPEPEPEPEPKPKPEPKPLLEPGDDGTEVRELQGRLSQLAWFTPPMTGSYDDGTRQGVEGFQDKRGLAATGTVDPRTWRRLVTMTRMPSPEEMFNRAGPALFEVGDESSDVRDVQARLRQIAWFSGDVSDFYGDRTVEAVRGFQARRLVPVTGKVDRRTLDLLTAMTAEPSADDLANRTPEVTEVSDPAEGSRLDSRCTTGRALCIDKSSNSLRWVVDGTVQMSVDVRFGAEFTPTREGSFSVYWKDRDHVSDLYGSAMPLSMFFSGGQAVHYSSDFAARGYSGASHGCVNVRDYTALAALFDQVSTGDRVVVYRS